MKKSRQPKIIMKKQIFIILIIFFLGSLSAQTNKKIEYYFPVYDGSTNYLGMRQSNQLYFSTYDFCIRNYYNFIFENFNLENRWTQTAVISVPFLLNTFFLTPLTHEEGHRSVLTSKQIGAVSQPLFNFKNPLVGVAYVKGVTDSTLKNLRDNDFAYFIRLHTAGLESDYCLQQDSFQKMALNLDYKISFESDNEFLSLFMNNILLMEYFGRYLSAFSYETLMLSDILSGKSTLKLVEEENELDRDIVGHDVYGMIHHLYNPDGEYHRYYDYSDLSDEEKKFAKRVALKSLLNFPFGLLFTKKDFAIHIGENVSLSFNPGYCLAPFGDFIDENFYLRLDNITLNPLCFSMYIREYQNKNNWFPAFGIKLVEFSPCDFLTISCNGDFWVQPQELDFNSKIGKPGFSIDTKLNLYLPESILKNQKSTQYGISFGFMYKTFGFLPGINQHESGMIFSAGLCLKY